MTKQRSYKLTPHIASVWYDLVITMDGIPKQYLLSTFPTDWGRGFRLETFPSGEVYNVNILGEDSSCECLGFTQYGHCKHVLVLISICERKLI